MIRTVRANWRTAYLVCGKCSKKIGGGFGTKGRTPLAKLLRKRAGARGRKAAFGVIETKCLKLCPKGAVTLIDTARPDRWHVVKAGTDVDALLAGLAGEQEGAVTPAQAMVERDAAYTASGPDLRRSEEA